MKFIKVLVLVIMFLSCLPLHGFCDDDCEKSSSHSCILVCPTCSHTVALPATHISLVAMPALKNIFVSSYSFSYENPTRIGFKRPPVISA